MNEQNLIAFDREDDLYRRHTEREFMIFQKVYKTKIMSGYLQ